jgi:hypothetical protein
MRAETGRAVLAATALEVRPETPPLSSLVGRVATSRGLLPGPLLGAAAGRHLSVAAAVTSPPPVPQPPTPAPPLPSRAGCALLAAHGGAGVSSLLRAGLAAAGGVDAGRTWPDGGAALLVARSSTSGLEAAREAARAHAAGDTGLDVTLLGLVLVADAPGRLPPRLRDLADLVAGAFLRVWQVPWLTEWRLAATTEPLPAHPEVTRLITDLRALTGARPTWQGDPR